MPLIAPIAVSATWRMDNCCDRKPWLGMGEDHALSPILRSLLNELRNVRLALTENVDIGLAIACWTAWPSLLLALLDLNFRASPASALPG